MQTETLTFEELKKLDPRLAELEASARRVAAAEARKRVRCCGNRAWYTMVKPRLVLLVGHLRRDGHPVLSTSAAYDCVYDALYPLMPACRVCGCM